MTVMATLRCATHRRKQRVGGSSTHHPSVSRKTARAPSRWRRCPRVHLAWKRPIRLADRPHVDGPRPLGTLGQLKLDSGPLTEGSKPFRFDIGLMNESVLTLVGLDESEAFGFIEPLYGAFWHNNDLYCFAPPTGPV